jgi:predicted ester cyclase
MMSDAERNKAVVEEFDAILNTHDLSRLDELCMPDMVNHALASGRPQGLEGTREFLASSFGHRFATDGWERLNVIAEGDFVVQHGVRGGRWPGGPFLGFEAEPGEYEREVVFVFRLKDGKIAERWAIRDDLTMLRQLGALPKNPAG